MQFNDKLIHINVNELKEHIFLFLWHNYFEGTTWFSNGSWSLNNVSCDNMIN